MSFLSQLTPPARVHRLLCPRASRYIPTPPSTVLFSTFRTTSTAAKTFVRPLTTSTPRNMPSAAGGHPHPPDGIHEMHEEDKESWKHRVPYRVHENDENFQVKWTGSCHCGKVKYQLSRDRPLVAKYCHCTTCQRLHGRSTLAGVIVFDGTKARSPMST